MSYASAAGIIRIIYDYPAGYEVHLQKLSPGSNTIPHSITPQGGGITRQAHARTRSAGVAVGRAAIADSLKTPDTTPYMASNVIGSHVISLSLTTLLISDIGGIGVCLRRSRRIGRSRISVSSPGTGMSHSLNQKTHNQRNKTSLHKNLREVGNGWHDRRILSNIPVPG